MQARGLGGVTESFRSRLAPTQFNLRKEASLTKDVAKFDEEKAKYWVDGWQIIRPTGNPLNYDSLKKMFMSDDIKFISSDFVAINSTKVLARCFSAASLSCARWLLSASHVA